MNLVYVSFSIFFVFLFFFKEYRGRSIDLFSSLCRASSRLRSHSIHSRLYEMHRRHNIIDRVIDVYYFALIMVIRMNASIYKQFAISMMMMIFMTFLFLSFSLSFSFSFSLSLSLCPSFLSVEI